MNFQLTNAAVDALNGALGPIELTMFRLGSASNYIPSSTDTGLRGSVVYSGTPSSPIVMNANIVKYSLYLDYDVGPFSFGEIAIYTQLPGQMTPFLFALGAKSALIDKIPLSETDANSIRADIYLSMVGTNYEMWLDLAESNNRFRIAIAESPDQIPPSKDAVPNTYIIQGASSNQAATIAYTDRNALWNFDRYSQSMNSYEIIAASNHSVSVRATDFSNDLNPIYKGQKILQFNSGAVYGVCRYVTSASIVGSSAVLQFSTPLAIVPKYGDRFFILTRRLDATMLPIPIATTTNLGAVIVGEGLNVDNSGLLQVNEAWMSDKVVTSVNGSKGDVEIVGLINPQELNTTQNMNSLIEPGLFFATKEVVDSLINGPGPTVGRKAGTLEVLPSLDPIPGGDVIQRWTQDNLILIRKKTGGVWSDWVGPASYSLPPATAATLGGVIVGAGLSVEPNGLIEAQVKSVNGEVGHVQLDKDSIGLDHVENKSSSEILSELTSSNVLDALTFTPVNRAGDTMQGPLHTSGPFTSSTEIVNKGYVDLQVGQAFNPAGLSGQVLYLQADGTSPYGYEDNVKFGTFINSDEEFEQAEEGFVNQATMFNSWHRLSHSSSNYSQPASTTEVDAWTYDGSTDTVSCTMNTVTMVGFVSNLRYSSYELETRLMSTANDDDVIGVLIAFTTDENGREHTLTAIRTCGYDSDVIWWELFYNFSRPDQLQLTNGSSTATSSFVNWSDTGVGSTVRIHRSGDLIEAWCSQLGQTQIDSGTLISVDLTSDPRLEKFRGPKSYGFVAKSQQNATFNDTVFSEPSNTIYDTRDGSVWVADSNGNYQLDSNKTIHGVWGPNRILFNPDTRKLYYTVYGGGTELLSDPNGGDPVEIASTSNLGIVQIGTGLSITPQGVLNAQVRSVNGKTGDVVLSFDDVNVPVATTSNVGVVSVGPGLSVTVGGELSVDLPIASPSVLGVIRVGNGLSIDPSGVLSADGITLNLATTTSPGIMQVGSGLSVNASGIVSVNWEASPRAGVDHLGMVQVGNGLSIDSNGVISLDYTLPIASASVLGGVRVGSGLTINSSTGVLSTSADPVGIATTTNTGIVQIGSGINVNASGVISINWGLSPYATTGQAGVVRVGSGLSIDSNGIISLNYSYTLPTASASVLGGIRVGSGLTIDGAGVLSANPSSVGYATTSTPGIVQIGAGISVTGNGTISTNWGASPRATTSSYGVVRIGSGLTVNDGEISVSYSLPTASASTIGGIRVGAGLSIDGSGILSVTGGGGGSITRIETGTVATNGVSLVQNSPVTSGTATIKSIRTPSGYGVVVEDFATNAVAIRLHIPSKTVTTTPVITWNSLDTSNTANQYIRYNGTADVNVTVPPVIQAPYFQGSPEIHFRQVGAGKITFVPGSGVTINPPFKGNLTTAGPGATITLKQVGSGGTEFDLIGQVEEV